MMAFELPPIHALFTAAELLKVSEQPCPLMAFSVYGQA
jgi:hypothetical protein